MSVRATFVGLLMALLLIASGSVAQAALVWAGDDLVNLDATGLPLGAVTTWSNAGTLGDFTAAGGFGGIDGLVHDVGGVNAMLFVAQNYYRGPAAPASITGVESVSIEVWAQNPSIASEETMVAWGKRGGAPDASNMSFNYGNHSVYGAVGHWGPTDLGYDGGVPEAGQWHHLTYTYDGTTQRVYVDGAENAFEDVALNIHAGPDILIASQMEGDGTTPTGGLRGDLSLAKIRIHSEVLAAADVLNNYNEEKAGFPYIEPPGPPEPVKPGALPVHRWSFNEEGGAGTTLADSIGGADGTIVDGGANDGTVGGGQVTLAGGGKDASDYVQLPEGVLGDGTSVTIEAWATQHTVQNWSRVFSFGLDTSNNMLMAWTRGTDFNLDRAGMKVAGNETSVDETMAPYTLDQEFHIAMTVEEVTGPFGNTTTLISLYKDGVYQGGRTTPHKLTDIIDTNNFLGRSQYGDNTANASWNEVRIWDYALTEGELLYTDGWGADVVPEPGSIALLLLGLVGLGLYRLRRGK